MPHAAATIAVTVCGGQGVRRSCNWRKPAEQSVSPVARLQSCASSAVALDTMLKSVANKLAAASTGAAAPTAASLPTVFLLDERRLLIRCCFGRSTPPARKPLPRRGRCARLRRPLTRDDALCERKTQSITLVRTGSPADAALRSAKTVAARALHRCCARRGLGRRPLFALVLHFPLFFQTADAFAPHFARACFMQPPVTSFLRRLSIRPLLRA